MAGISPYLLLVLVQQQHSTTLESSVSSVSNLADTRVSVIRYGVPKIGTQEACVVMLRILESNQTLRLMKPPSDRYSNPLFPTTQ